MLTLRLRRRWLYAGVAATLGLAVPAATAATGTPGSGAACPPAWGSYGNTPELTFEVAPGCSGIDTTTVHALTPAWFFHASDSVTATPAVVNGVAYVGAWDGSFYAIDAASGALKWTTKLPVSSPTAFGRIVSSATVTNFHDNLYGGDRRVVLVGGGSTLFALDAASGRTLASLDLDPRTPATKAAQQADPPVVEIESSPAVTDLRPGHPDSRMIYVGLDVHNAVHVGRTGVVAAQLSSSKAGTWSLTPVWKSDGETGATYRGVAGLTQNSGTGQGCGDVWSSPAVDAAANVLVYGTGNCDHSEQSRQAGFAWAEAMVGVQADTGKLLWRYTPAAEAGDEAAQTAAASNDADFGASPNIFTIAGGHQVVGEGSKSGFYYVRDLRTGAKVWSTLAGQSGVASGNFAVGGFLGTTAVQSGPDGHAVRIIGATAIPIPQSTDDLDRTTWAVRALDADTGAIEWTNRLAGPTYSASSVVNGVAFVPDTTNSDVVAIDADTGLTLGVLPVIGPPSSAPAVAGNEVIVGTGTRETDLEYKAFGLSLQQGEAAALGESPLSPASGVMAYRLPLTP